MIVKQSASGIGYFFQFLFKLITQNVVSRKSQFEIEAPINSYFETTLYFPYADISSTGSGKKNDNVLNQKVDSVLSLYSKPC